MPNLLPPQTLVDVPEGISHWIPNGSDQVHAQAQDGCPELIKNGGFELGGPGSVAGGWVSTNEAQPAVANTSIVREGERSLQVGMANSKGTSIVRQTVRLPEGNGRTILSFRYYPFSAEEPSADDLQYIEIFNDFNSQLIRRLVVRASPEPTWQWRQFDLTSYAGQQVTIYFSVQSDGVGGLTGMYVDDVSLTSCNSPTEDGGDSDAGENEAQSRVAGASGPASQVQPFLTSTPTAQSVVAAATCPVSGPNSLSIGHVLINNNQSAVINIAANNSVRVIVTGPNNFAYSSAESGPHAVEVQLQPGANAYTVSVEYLRTESNCQQVTDTRVEPVLIPGPTPTPVVCTTTTPEPFSVQILDTSNPVSKVIRVTIGNGDRVEVRGGPQGTVTKTGSSPFDFPVTLNPNTTYTFETDAHVRSINLGNGCTVGDYTRRDIRTYRITDTPTPTHTPTPTATFTPLPPIAPSTCGAIAMAPRPASCQSIIINGSFETNDGWHFGVDPVSGAYTNEQASVGGRSVVLGNPPNRGPATAITYSSIRQPVTIPANVEQLQLRWRRLDVSEEGASPNPSGTADRQDVIILSGSGYSDLEPIEIVSRLRCNSNGWKEFAVNLDANRYAHDRNVVVYFNVFNDGAGGRSWSYLDNVELLVCPAPGSYTNPGPGYSGSDGKGSTYIQVQPPAFSATSTPTPRAVALATYTPYTVVLPTATSVSYTTPPGGEEAYPAPAVITVVVTATPLAPANAPIGQSANEGATTNGEQTVEEQSPSTQSTNTQTTGSESAIARSTGLASVSEVEASNQFLSNQPWFNWLTSCGILLGILAVIGYFAWGILRTLADEDPYDNDG